MKDPLVSILVVCFNHESYVKTCLESCIKQSYKNIEIVIADDYSKDKSKDVILKFLERNVIPVKLVFNEQNIGFQATLNKCMEYIQGKYISIIAADDFFLIDKLKLQVRKMEEIGEEYGMVYSDFSIVNENGNVIEKSKFESKYGHGWLPPSGNIFSNITTDFFTWAQASLIRMECLRKNDFKFQKNIISEDWFLSLYISRYYKIYALNEIVSSYRILPTSVSRTNFLGKGLLNVYMSHFRMFSIFYKHPLNSKDENKLLYKQLLKSVLFIIENSPRFSIKKIIWMWNICRIKLNLIDLVKMNKLIVKSALR